MNASTTLVPLRDSNGNKVLTGQEEEATLKPAAQSARDIAKNERGGGFEGETDLATN